MANLCDSGSTGFDIRPESPYCFVFYQLFSRDKNEYLYSPVTEPGTGSANMSHFRLDNFGKWWAKFHLSEKVFSSEPQLFLIVFTVKI